MNIKNIILLALLLTPFALFAQWLPTANISPSNNDYAITMADNGNGTLIASSWTVGLFRTTDNGLSWAKTSYSGPRVYKLTCSPEGHFFALATSNSSISVHRSTNDGIDWQEIYFESRSNNFAFGGGTMFIDSVTFYAALSFTLGPTIGDIGVRYLKTTDAGASWTNMGLFNGAGFINELAAGMNGMMYAATSLSGVIVSANGTNWNLTPFTHFTRSVNVNSRGDVFAASGSVDPEVSKIWRSTDNGTSWMPTPLTGGAIRAMLIDDKDVIFVSNDAREVYRSTDDGASWDTVTYGLPSNQAVYSFTGSTRDFVFAGTGSNGVFRYGEKIVSTNYNTTEIPGSFNLLQNYPNPFNPSTTIEFKIPGTSFVSLKVYDMLGKEVEVLVSGQLNQGNYEVNWNAGNLNSGVYFYKINADGFTEVKKMILMK